jgi:hydroxyethylthiazole kinase-like uncharacterized protein yjeF
MQPVFSAAQSRAFDKRLIEDIGIPSLVLMENAARSAFEVIRAWAEPLEFPHILIYCGCGNNGGDGLALARMLLDIDAIVEVRLVGDPEAFSKDARAEYDILVKLSPGCIDPFDPDEDTIAVPDIIVDALLGTGSHGALREDHRNAVTMINEALSFGKTKTLAIDLPTGLDPDRGCMHVDDESAVHATATVTMGAAKLGFFMGHSSEVIGEIVVANIGVAASFEMLEGQRAYLVEPIDIVSRLPQLRANASKFSRGRVLAVCGSRGMTGAAIMAGTTALRTGSGLVNVAVPKSERSLVAQAMPELLTVGLSEQEDGGPDLHAYKELEDHIGHADALLIGSGLRAWPGTADLLRKLIVEVEKPIVIDAGALRSLVGYTDILKQRKAPTILTPHSGEIASLVERPWEEVENDRFETARRFAKEYGVVVVMKGAPTYVFDPDGTAYINPTGNAGLATAGSGDVLAGMLVGLLAQLKGNALDAAIAGVFLHGLAGDLAADAKTKMGMTATDVTEMLPVAFKSLGIV